MPKVLASFVTMWAISALRSSALEGMQPTLRQTPPQYFSSTTATVCPSCAARIAATYPPGPAPRTRTLKCVVTAASLLTCGRSLSIGRLVFRRDVVRRLRDEPRSRPDGRALPALPAVDHRLGAGLAAHLRRRGARLGRRPLDDRRGSAGAGVRGRLRRHPRGRVGPRRVGGGRLRPLPQDPRPGRHADRLRRRLDLRPRRLRGRPPLRVVPRRARRRRRGRRRPRRLRRRPPPAPLPLDGAVAEVDSFPGYPGKLSLLGRSFGPEAAGLAEGFDVSGDPSRREERRVQDGGGPLGALEIRPGEPDAPPAGQPADQLLASFLRDDDVRRPLARPQELLVFDQDRKS